MALSRKYYIQFADMFKDHNERITEAEKALDENDDISRCEIEAERKLFNSIVMDTCRLFASDNYRFDRDRFWNWIENK